MTTAPPLSNTLNLPAGLAEAVRNDPYDKGGADFSVTELLQPARLRVLRQRHRHEIVEDVSERIWALLGQAAHAIVARQVTNDLQETRLTIERNGVTVSGCFDSYRLESGLLEEYKVTSAWAVMGDLKPEWEAQLNLYALMLREHGYAVNALRIVAILRDWSRTQAQRSADYPQQQVAVLDVPLWEPAVAEAYLAKRIAAHRAAEHELPECTPEERWQRPTRWAVMKQGRKSALRLLDSEGEAMTWGVDNAKPGESLSNGKLWIEKRPGESVRCANYCPVGKAGLCAQWEALREEEAA